MFHTFSRECIICANYHELPLQLECANFAPNSVSAIQEHYYKIRNVINVTPLNTYIRDSIVFNVRTNIVMTATKL